MGLHEIYSHTLMTKREIKMDAYWPSSFVAFLWTETKSGSIKTQKKNKVNIQPSTVDLKSILFMVFGLYLFSLP